LGQTKYLIPCFPEKENSKNKMQLNLAQQSGQQLKVAQPIAHGAQKAVAKTLGLLNLPRPGNATRSMA
jgi:hypothetical protein